MKNNLHLVTHLKPLRECGIEELAGHVRGMKQASSGISFARRSGGTEKELARTEILKLLSNAKFPTGLSILTMPGLDWNFERQLLNMREGHWKDKPGPHCTYISSIENDRAIYHAAVTRLPGLHQEGSVVVTLPNTSFAESVLRNRWIVRYFFGSVDDLMVETDYSYDVVWLDYTGPISETRLEIIAKFYKERINKLLIVTSLRARWDNETNKQVNLAGGYAPYLISKLPGTVLHQIEYMDSSPMLQVAISK